MQLIARKSSYSSDSDHDITRCQTVPVFGGQMHQLIFCEAGDGDLVSVFAEMMKMLTIKIYHSNLSQKMIFTTATG
jgi:hypothetical protein